MSVDVRIEINHAALRDLLRSNEVLDELRRRAEAIAEAAARNVGAVNPEPPTYDVSTYQGRNRARASVATSNDAARAGEARHHWLLGALDAGR